MRKKDVYSWKEEGDKQSSDYTWRELERLGVEQQIFLRKDLVVQMIFMNGLRPTNCDYEYEYFAYSRKRFC